MLRVLLIGGLVLAQAEDKKPEPAADGPPKADVRGKVEKAFGVKARGVVGSLLIKGSGEKGVAHDSASVRVTTTTKIARWQAGKKVPALFGDIKKGDRVQATFVGPVAESSPVQATAAEVLILEMPKAEK